MSVDYIITEPPSQSGKNWSIVISLNVHYVSIIEENIENISNQFEHKCTVLPVECVHYGVKPTRKTSSNQA